MPFNDKPAGAPTTIKLLGLTCIYDPGNNYAGADWQDPDFGAELIYTPAPPLGLTSITLLGRTATWERGLAAWISSASAAGPYGLVITPASPEAVDGKVLVSINYIVEPPPPSSPWSSLTADAVDLVAAVAAGHFVMTDDPTENWVYHGNDDDVTPHDYAGFSNFPTEDYPVDPPAELGSANLAFTSSTSGYAGPNVFVGDNRNGANDYWYYRKFGGNWTPDDVGLGGNATTANAPVWDITVEKFRRAGDTYPGVPLDYATDHIGPEFSDEPDWFKN
jgi:hypothetical protein